MSVTYAGGSAKVEQCPTGERMEYAFIGRSNVGKSSLINMLTRRKGLALTSQTPGKTQLIHHYLINNAWYMVDLPGYGYAQRGKEGRERMRSMIEEYILKRAQMANLFVLLDSRLAPQPIDLSFIQWLGENAVPFALVFTKTDKISNGRLTANIEVYRTKLLERWETLPPVFCSSAVKGKGREEILAYINDINRRPPR